LAPPPRDSGLRSAVGFHPARVGRGDRTVDPVAQAQPGPPGGPSVPFATVRSPAGTTAALPRTARLIRLSARRRGTESLAVDHIPSSTKLKDFSP